MTDEMACEYQKAINELGENINKALNSPYVKNPIAWALYQTWKQFDKRSKSRGLEKRD